MKRTGGKRLYATGPLKTSTADSDSVLWGSWALWGSSSTPGLFPLGATTFTPVMAIRNVSRHARMSPGTAVTAVKCGLEVIKGKVHARSWGPDGRSGDPLTAGKSLVPWLLGMSPPDALSYLQQDVWAMAVAVPGAARGPTARGPHRRPAKHLGREMCVRTTVRHPFTPTRVAGIQAQSLAHAAAVVSRTAARRRGKPSGKLLPRLTVKLP